MVSDEKAERIQQAINEGYEALDAVQLHAMTCSNAMKRLHESGATSHGAGSWCEEARWLYGLLNDRLIGIMTIPNG